MSGTRSTIVDRGQCAGTVSYKGNSTTQCKRTAASRDGSGVWWCGLHHPDKVKEAVTKLLNASKAAMCVLHEIAAIKDVGWPENTPAQKYSIILSDINARALKAGDQLRDEIADTKLGS